MSGSAQPSAHKSLVQCALLASATWLILFYFGRHILYGGDDSAVLLPLFEGGLAQSLGRFLRPLEYWVALLSCRIHAPLWLGISFLAYVATCIATLWLLRIVSGTTAPPLWQVLVCASTPLAAQAYFQVDTTSQALANLFSLLYAIVAFGALRSSEPQELQRRGWYMAALGLLCILSKETTYGMVFLGALLLLLRHPRAALAPAGTIVMLLVAAVLWRIFYHYGVVAESGFGFKPNPLYWAFGFIFSAVVAASPLPTSIVLSGAYAVHPALIAISAAGLLTIAAGVLLYFRAPKHLWQTARRFIERRDVGDVQLLLWLFLFASMVPTVFFKAAELYASQMTPILKVLLLTLPVTQWPAFTRTFWTACSGLWLLASTINVMSYSVATGYDARGRALYAPIVKAVYAAPRVYSIYYRRIYTEDTYSDDATGCVLSRRSPGICLPRNIASGAPRRL